MTPQQHSRRIGTDPSSARIAAKRRFRRASRTTVTAADASVLMFLSEVLVGDNAWTLTEVQQLVALRERAGLDRDRESRFEDAGTIQF
jgi:hypothetical protein